MSGAIGTGFVLLFTSIFVNLNTTFWDGSRVRRFRILNHISVACLQSLTI